MEDYKSLYVAVMVCATTVDSDSFCLVILLAGQPVCVGIVMEYRQCSDSVRADCCKLSGMFNHMSHLRHNAYYRTHSKTASKYRNTR